MGKHEEKRQARKEARKGVNLKSKLVSTQLLGRYELALTLLTTFFADCGLAVRTLDDLDEAVSAYLEHIFFEGEPKGLASDTLASVQFHMPKAAGHLRMSWKLLKAWQKVEPPARVVPISPLLVRAFAGACVVSNRLAEAAALLVAFDALLRPGELYLLKVEDITFYQTKAVITLRDSKTGKRRNTGEMVVVNSVFANHYLRLACRSLRSCDHLLPGGASSFRLLFNNLVDFFQLAGLYAVYSLRRGGATFDFLMHQSMERTLLRGRWSSTSTARIYLQDTIATVASLSLTPVQKAHALRAASVLTAQGHCPE